MTTKLVNALPLLLLAGVAAPAHAVYPPLCDESNSTQSVTSAECAALADVWQPTMAPNSPIRDITAVCPTISDSPMGVDQRCVDSTMAPSPTVLGCEDMGDGTLCEAWPQGDGITYSWSVTGSLSLPYPGNPANPFRIASCWKGGSGTITVTVSSPYALSSSKTQSYYCAP